MAGLREGRVVAAAGLEAERLLEAAVRDDAGSGAGLGAAVERRVVAAERLLEAAVRDDAGLGAGLGKAVTMDGVLAVAADCVAAATTEC